MSTIEFDDVIETGALGRNGWFRVSGAQVEATREGISIEPITGRGEIGRARIVIPQENAAEVARALIEQAIRSRPDLREAIAAELRAAVIAVEDGIGNGMEDTISTHFAPYRP